ncbi:MAG: RNA polymerase sigma factor [Ilumatobacter sp.]|uniref:RNA polymerase sigma factor n=1 Tax=Ilumatobacter sp. TaxID=1967498 RepID=UPI00391906AB
MDVWEPNVSGDARAARVDAFSTEYRPRAVAWATALTGRVDVGEELAQDSLISTVQRLDDTRNPGGYLRVTVVNACRSWHRATTREQQRLAATRRETSDHSISESSMEMLDLLTELPYRHRAALLLRFWAGWSDGEIAEALGCRQASVRVFVHRGLKALRSVIDSNEEAW